MMPIKTVQKTETKYFGKEPVREFWLEIAAAAASGHQGDDHINKLIACLDSCPKDGVICIFSEELSGKKLCEALAKARDNGNRIYILTNNYHDEMKNLEGCLIRYGGGKRIGSFILINPNPNSGSPSGCLFTGRFSEGSMLLPENLLLDLDTDQVSILFRYFCYQFWNKAEKERIGQEERNTDAAPLDIYPPAGDSCDLEYLKSVWGKESEGAVITTSLLKESPYLHFANFSNSKVISLLSGIDNDLVRSLKQKKNEIHTLDGEVLLNIIMTSDDYWLIPKINTTSEEEVYAIKLNSQQTEKLNVHFNDLLNGKTQYQYIESDIRENLSGKTLFRLGYSVSQKYAINAEGRSSPETAVPTMLLSKEEFENQKPDFTDDGKSVSIIYEWTNIPFTLPSGSKRHHFYQDWEDEKKHIVAYIEHIHETISDSEKKAGMGIKQKFSEYQSELKKLREIEYGSIEELELQEKIKLINKIGKYVENRSSEISEENRKEQINQQIKGEENKRKEQEKECETKEKELDETKKQKEIQSKILEELEKEKKDESKEIKIKEVKKLVEELKIKISKITSDKDKLKNQIRRIADEEKRLNNELNRPVKEIPKAQSILKNLQGGGNKSNYSISTGDLPVPKLPRLPQIGDLYKHNGQSYLAIQHWEEYDKGQAEAKRLNAKLCAKGENNG